MNRTQLFQQLIAKFGYQSYLEIGCETDKTFGWVDLPRKVGVDPQRGGTHRMTSDEFFAQAQAQAQDGETFDLVFVDGLHRREQVVRDVENAARCLNPGGCIVLHDCLPTEREQQLPEPVRPEHVGKAAEGNASRGATRLRGAAWTGDVWKAVVDLRQRAEFDLAVLDADWGLGVLFVRPNSDRLEAQRELEWEDYVAGRERLLRIVDEDGIRRFIETDGSDVQGRRSPEQESRFTAIQSGVKPPHSKDGPTIAFAHGALGQFEPLHRYLNESGLADSYLFCTEGNHRVHQARVPKLLAYKPHGGKLSEPQSFYHLGRVEAANRRSLGLRKALREFQKRQRIDLLVAHVTMGSPSLLFDEFDFPIVSYVEFPSFRHHGWDTRYPPTEGQQLRDKNFEMLAAHCVLKSDRTLVPSEYARSMFAAELRPRISVLMEGFPMHSESWSRNGVLPKEPGTLSIGFAARDLSSAKGFQQFVRIANRVAEQRPHVRFVVLGSDKTPYSYEDLFLDAKFGKEHGRTFRDWVLEHEQADRSRFLLPGLVDYDTFSRYVNDIDLFLYPLQFGSANWGLFELLGRGKPVIASNRCYVPEVITDGVNGLLCDYDDLDRWVRLTLELLDNPDRRHTLAAAARESTQRFSIDRVASEFLAMVRDSIANSKTKL